jgi:Family of unknown function (DUF6476)
MRALKILVVVMGVLLVAGTIALVVAVVARVNRPVTSSGLAAARASAIELPAGSRIVATQASGDRLVVRIALADGGEELLVFDLASGARVATITLYAKPATP